MYRLLIADDEPLEREGLELIIQRAMPDQFTIYHARNGREAIEKAVQYQPDIIFMDIKMPGIQGLEAISVIQKKLPDTKIVIVTAYDYFMYAKEAITLGVKEYMLKPAKRDNIVTLLQRLTDEVIADRSKRAQDLELFEQASHLRPLTENECTLMLMLDTIQDLDVAALSQMLEIDIQFGFATVVAFPKVQGEKEKRKIYECTKHYVKAQQSCLVSPVIEQHMAIFSPSYLQRDRDLQQEELIHDAKRLQEYIKKQTGYQLFIGIGSIQKGTEGWRMSYEEALYISKSCTEEKSILQFAKGREKSISEEEKEQLCISVSMLDNEAAIKRLRSIYEQLENKANGNSKRMRGELISLFNYLVEYVKRSHLQIDAFSVPDIDDMDKLQEMGEQYVLAMLYKIKRDRDVRTNYILTLAQAYITNNYMKDVSLEQVAEHVGLNSVYFSKLFKKQTGETFSDYLMNLRIERAKQLMKDDVLSLKEICFQVGYNDPNYFSRVFKKCTNESPKEYRQRILL